MNHKPNKIKDRKREHLNIFATEDVNFSKSNGFENFRLVHTSLPEIHFDKIDTSEKVFGYTLDFPVMISAITGGESKGEEINKALAQIAEKKKIAFGLGSLRPCFYNNKALLTFAIAKKVAPNIPVIGNIGGQQLLEHDIAAIHAILYEIQADALAIHLNPLQEVLQPEGDRNFIGIKSKIKEVVKNISLPVIIKEVGFGLPVRTIKELSQIGTEWFDIAGAGGTSWAKIEKHRNSNPVDIAVADEFSEFGVPTAEILSEAMKINGVNIIASGGINSGLDFTKAIAMGAKIVGSAGKILKTWNDQGAEGVEQLLDIFKKTLQIGLFMTGCKNLDEFRNFKNIEKI